MKFAGFLFMLFLVAFGVFLFTQAFRGEGNLFSFVQLHSPADSTTPFTVKNPAPVATKKSSSAPASGQRQTTQSTQTTQSAPVPPLGFSVSQLSPYYKKVSLGSVRHPYSVSDYQSQFTLYADSSLSAPVDVTGWRVKGNGAYGIEIPTAVADFQRSLIAYNPAYHGTDRITLRPGDYAIFYSGKSPMNGVSLRLNKCTGYLNETYVFSPSLPYECPGPDTSRLSLLSGKCQNYVYSMRTCRAPTWDSINASLDTSETECRAIVSKLNYDGCYAGHRQDSNFFSHEWRVWLNQFMPFDFLHDRLILYDRSGLVVNEYTY